MFSVTWIENGSLFKVTTPSMVDASRLFYALRIKAGKNARLWGKDKKLIF